MKANFLVFFFVFFMVVTNMMGCTNKQESQESQVSQETGAPNTGSAASSDTSSTVTAAGEAAKNAASVTDGQSKPQAVDLSTDASGLSKATVVLKTAKGVVKFKFYSKDAPNTVKRIVELIQSKFYNGLRFHRVVPGFVVQTGDPKSKNKDDPAVGTGGSGVKLKAEFNGRKHLRGTVAMARTKDPNSADSQFYITMGVFPHLDGAYTVFGMVTDFGERVQGQDVLERLTIGDEILDMHIE